MEMVWQNYDNGDILRVAREKRVAISSLWLWWYDNDDDGDDNDDEDDDNDHAWAIFFWWLQAICTWYEAEI